jgi:multicomponent Na+:H+ antiporter subunit F
MTDWLVASIIFIALLVGCGVITIRGSVIDRLLGLELGSVIGATAMLSLAEAFDRSIYVDLAVVFAATSFAASLMFARFLERWS